MFFFIIIIIIIIWVCVGPFPSHRSTQKKNLIVSNVRLFTSKKGPLILISDRKLMENDRTHPIHCSAQGHTDSVTTRESGNSLPFPLLLSKSIKNSIARLNSMNDDTTFKMARKPNEYTSTHGFFFPRPDNRNSACLAEQWRFFFSLIVAVLVSLFNSLALKSQRVIFFSLVFNGL